MTEIVATNIIASQLSEKRLTITLTARANLYPLRVVLAVV